MLVNDVHDTFESPRESSVFRLLGGVQEMVSVRTDSLKHAHGFATVCFHGPLPRSASYLCGCHLYSCSSAATPRVACTEYQVSERTRPEAQRRGERTRRRSSK